MHIPPFFPGFAPILIEFPKNTYRYITFYKDYNKSLVSLATHSQSRLNSFLTVKSLFCIAYLDLANFSSDVLRNLASHVTNLILQTRKLRLF